MVPEASLGLGSGQLNRPRMLLKTSSVCLACFQNFLSNWDRQVLYIYETCVKIVALGRSGGLHCSLGQLLPPVLQPLTSPDFSVSWACIPLAMVKSTYPPNTAKSIVFGSSLSFKNISVFPIKVLFQGDLLQTASLSGCFYHKWIFVGKPCVL